MSKKKNKKKRKVVSTTFLEKDKNTNPYKIWDRIIKDTIEEKYGKIK